MAVAIVIWSMLFGCIAAGFTSLFVILGYLPGSAIVVAFLVGCWGSTLLLFWRLCKRSDGVEYDDRD